MNERILELAKEHLLQDKYGPDGQVIEGDYYEFDSQELQDFVQLIVEECASEYNKLINGEAVVLPTDREHAEALVRVGMFYLENNK